jgi:hypothetical protein
MNRTVWSGLIGQLEAKGVIFDAGLSDSEIARAEVNYEINFPDDLRSILQSAFPNRFPFPNWRLVEDPHIRELLSMPLEGILFDVERNEFWLPEWGSKPSDSEGRRRIVEEKVKDAPRLIPIHSHRMMPSRPRIAGNPILSVHQTDIIYYGFDLDDYFRHEFGLDGRKDWQEQIRPIEFWEVERWQELRWR